MVKKNLLKLVLLIIFILLSFLSFSIYKLYRYKFVTIDENLTEISGIEFDKKGNLWAINDSGDDPKLRRDSPCTFPS